MIRGLYADFNRGTDPSTPPYRLYMTSYKEMIKRMVAVSLGLTANRRVDDANGNLLNWEWSVGYSIFGEAYVFNGSFNVAVLSVVSSS